MSSSSNNNNNGNSGSANRLHRVQKFTGERSTWRTNCKRQKRQIEAANSTASTTPSRANNAPFQLEHLPLNTLVIVASQLPLQDFQGIGTVSRKFNTAQRMTRHSRKCISVALLRRLFPDEPVLQQQQQERADDSQSKSAAPEDSNNSSVGMLQVMRPLRGTLRSSPPRNFNEVDLSEFSAFRESHFDELLKSVDNGRELFAEVRRLNVQGCVIEIKDMAFLAQLMPKVWSVRCSAHTLVLPEITEQKMTLSAEQTQQLQARVENFAHVSRQFTRKHLWFLAQLTELFPCLEEVQLDN